MHFYPSKNNNALNRRTFAPDVLTGRAMVNPHYRVDLAPQTQYIIDSGAFQERDMHYRLQPWQALDRQLTLESQIEYGTHGGAAEALVTYDCLIGVDEALIDGKRVKRRGNETTAQPAVEETLRSAAYYASQRDRVRGVIAYAAQGATPRQYRACVEELLTLMRPGRDWLAFGGFCIVGMQPSLKPLFAETLRAVLPRLRSAGMHRAHILGVTVADCVQLAAAEGRKHGIEMSTDSSSIEVNSIMGKTWSDGRWHKTYTKEQKYTEYHPCDLAHDNISRYHDWSQPL